MSHQYNPSHQQYHKLYISLLVLIALLPLPHGGELVWEHTPFISGSFLLLTLWLFQQWRYSRPLPDIIRSIKVPLILLCIWLIYPLIQILPLPESWLSLLNPAAYEINHQALIAGITPTNSLSIDSGSTFQEFLRYASYITLFFLLLALCDTKTRLKQLAVTLFLVGFAQALYSLINYYTNGAFSLNEPIPPWGTDWERATRGTYTHYNHFAALMEMTIPIGIGLVLSYSQHPHSDNNSNRLNQILSFIMSVRLLYIFGIAIMLAALIFSASRGGNGAFAAAFFITLVIFGVLRSNKAQTLKLLPIALIILISIVGLLGSGKLVDRFDKQGFGPNGRDHMRTTTYQLATDYPLFGSGTGTYPHIYYQYKLPELGITSMSKRAHNDYLELLTDQGIIGFSLLGTSIALLFFTIMKGIRTRHNPMMVGLLFGSTLGIISMLIHSLVEFNFHIPANASYFFVLLAIATIASSLKKQGQ